MPISAALKQRYTSDVNVDWREALIISHSAAGIFYISTHNETLQGLVDGVLNTFQPIPFVAVLPKSGSQGQQDLTLSICNVGQEMYDAINLAITIPTEAIRCRYTIDILGDTAPQYDPPLELSLTNIKIGDVVMSATATRSQIFNRPFPGIRYRPDTFPGLDRR
jgi:hypothetical protein